ncbi:acyl-CoA dehydrogenase family protein [Aliiglaciecola lipolytica]|uniref:Acyl-CoA dehydrogenase, C-terminal domain protein n=1 Tax=Aliiglaciecola lipolytica E3 TaxID=1127673 RepID=K6YTA3_9ALTE|nr:acyl-CoA dehydrogenase family protein [Aliiglaciecola lipolytica]GAC14525.1 acyl-CoA dehydrogenase, C-terminal domain protein [Aliiglaciecola lipolytica E3]
MSLVYSEDDRMLADTAEEFLLSKSPVAAQRTLRDSKSALNFDNDVWQQMVELGWTAITFPEKLGGLEFGYKGLGAVFESMGKHLTASPLLSSVVLCGSLLEQLANDSQLEWLNHIISGEKRLALAIDEKARHEPFNFQTEAVDVADGFVLSGKKVMVMDGLSADGWVVSAKHKEGVSLFIVPFSEDVIVKRTNLVDSRNYAELTFNELTLPVNALLGNPGDSIDAINHSLDLGRLCLSSEILGASKALFDMTVEYLKTREQFGVKIGTFQALQHRAANCYVELELAQSCVIAALSNADDTKSDLGLSASLAKCQVSKAADLITREAIQMHGGIGVTDELDIGLYLKRIRVAQMSLGDADFHQARYGELKNKM